MRLSLDGRSLAIGVFAGAAAVAGFGAAQAEKPEAGRFQVAATVGPGGVPFAYVADTATGQVWREDGVGFADDKSGDRRRSQ